ncbi:MAG TPA: phosphoenolpyruvate--protein phosphotransferase [Microbacteriaceae bacterium]|nr:phosphoenolpyruvate--protein phosphotransferase [Microbacteriaceae bacterium]
MPMIGIVVVSHSPALAQAAVGLALEMVSGTAPRIEVAAGAGDDIIGTDAVRVAEAITTVAGDDGVLVFTDLGSAVLSAQMATELAGVDKVLLTDAPFVEGLTAAVVSAAQGRALHEVEREARGALAAKTAQLAPEGVADTGAAGGPAGRGAETEDATSQGATSHSVEGSGSPASPERPRPERTPEPTVDALRAEVPLTNPSGLHARPAGMMIGALAGLDARVWVRREGGRGEPVEVTGTTALLMVGARKGDTVEFRAAGADAALALERLTTLAADGFGESDDGPAAAGQVAAGPTTAGPTAAGQPSAGVGVSPGRAVAPIVRRGPGPAEPARRPMPADEREAECVRARSAFAGAADFYRSRAAGQSGQSAQILGVGALLAEDEGLIRAAEQRIREAGDNAEYAVWQAAGQIARQLADAGSLAAERATDLRDVRDRVIALLTHPADTAPGAGGPAATDARPDRYILVAADLAPADTAGLDPARCVGIVTAGGGPTSHTSILARSLGIPAVVAAPQALTYPEGTWLFIDGGTGRIVPDPDEDTRRGAAENATLAFDGTGHTSDGRRISLLANIGSAADAVLAAGHGAEGVGLFRTEFLFLGRTSEPTFEEQVASYRQALAEFPGRKVVIRTLDAGADKPLPFMAANPEDNPALGVRGFRTASARPEVLQGQLAAIAEAARTARADVQVMAPMVDTVEEAARFANAARKAGLPLAGIMIETPAAALTAPELFRVVDFVSLGTNDLTQYTMAADRLSGALASLNDPWQPAVLRLIQGVAAAGQAAGKPVGVCGEAASDPNLAVVLVGFGVTSLSMTPRALGPVAARLKAVPFARCVAAARAAAAAHDARSARDAAAAAAEA